MDSQKNAVIYRSKKERLTVHSQIPLVHPKMYGTLARRVVNGFGRLLGKQARQW